MLLRLVTFRWAGVPLGSGFDSMYSNPAAAVTTTTRFTHPLCLRQTFRLASFNDLWLYPNHATKLPDSPRKNHIKVWLNNVLQENEDH